MLTGTAAAEGLFAAANYRGPAPAAQIDPAFVGTFNMNNSWSTPGPQYVLVVAGDFAGWTDFATEHPGLVAGEDANGKGVGNFLNSASGQDPEAGGLLPVVELSGSTLTLRRWINALDAAAVAAGLLERAVCLLSALRFHDVTSQNPQEDRS